MSPGTLEDGPSDKETMYTDLRSSNLSRRDPKCYMWTLYSIR